jgi:hypothetical protein
MLPLPIITIHAGFKVVRDDLLHGGTKRRVIQPLVAQDHHHEFVYASPAFGYAQLALAVACREVGKRATIFTAKRNHPHPLTLAAKDAGAKIVMIPHGYLSNVQSKARAYAAETGAALIPFGVDTDASLDAIAAAALSAGEQPHEVWTVSGSGTLTRGLQRAFPNAAFHTVLIGKKDANVGRAKAYIAPESFEQDAKILPPYPSCKNYDAKLWQFAKRHATPGALIWNVGS